MKLHRETVHDPSGLPAFRLYEYGPYSLTTWPGKNNRDARPRVRKYKGKSLEIKRREMALMLNMVRDLRRFAP